MSTSTSSTSATSSTASFTPELIELQKQEEIRLEHEVNEFKSSSEGLNSEKALTKVFELFDVWIQLYRLEKTDALLAEIEPFCKQFSGKFYLQYIQMLAFCRWKQSRFGDALRGFLEMEQIVGPNVSLCENIGHTYNSMGNLKKAEEYFTTSLRLAEEEAKKPRDKTETNVLKREGNKGGVLLGLGIIKDRQGKLEEALPILISALEWYQDKFQNSDASLVAKAHSSVGHTHERLGYVKTGKEAEDHFQAAERHYREAIRIFIVTCGDDSPLTSSAMGALGKVLCRPEEVSVGGESAPQFPQDWRNKAISEKNVNRFVEGLDYLSKSLGLEVQKDSIQLLSIYELLVKILEIQTTLLKSPPTSAEATPPNAGGRSRLRQAFLKYVPIILDAERNMKRQGISDNDGNWAAFLKTAGEYFLVANETKEAIRVLTRAVELFERVTEIDVSQLLHTCKQLVDYAKHTSQD